MPKFDVPITIENVDAVDANEAFAIVRSRFAICDDPTDALKSTHTFDVGNPVENIQFEDYSDTPEYYATLEGEL